ncbi:hypothetical protein ACROYT_G029570 [Oculina patagonica]
MGRSQETRPFIPQQEETEMEERDGILFNNTGARLSKQRRKRKITLAFIAIAFVAILTGLLYYYFSRKVKEYEEIVSDESQQIEVKIHAGVVHGNLEGNAIVFKGIPYAKPPIGNQRWKAPVPCDEHMNKCWNGTLNASEFGSMCAQPDVLHTKDPSKVIGSEDCLFINVWTPKKRPSEKLLPVLVYIHGGFLMYSSGDWNGLHPPPEMVCKMNIVGVSFNYRLNAFGFLALKSLAEISPSKTSGNYGFMDQILALKWVQANIKKFGGDPESVTLIGQSSGGTSELALLASPGAAGLFHRAILMSGSVIFNKSWEDAALDNEILVKNSKCVRNSSVAERECLYKLSPEQIEVAVPWDVYPYWAMADLMDLPTKGLFDGAVAVVDKHVVPKPPLNAIMAGEANDVPLIIGTTAQEINIQPVKNFANTTWEDYISYVKEKLFPFVGNNVSEVLSMYNKTMPDGSSARLQFAYTSMSSDIRVNCPNNVFALNASRGFNSLVYRYVVTNSPSSPINLIGFPATFAVHMWDLVALFGFPTAFNYTPSSKDLRFMTDLRKEFSKFIHDELKDTSWKEYPENTALFTDNGVKVLDEDGYHKEECEFWLDNGFFPYAWIN